MDRRMPMLAMAIAAISLAMSFSTLPPAAAAANDPSSPPPYTNHTVGGPAGWFFNLTTNSSATNYSSWASAQSFNLGDYLIFNTNSNMSVIQTYNQTTYGLCDTSGDEGNDYFVYTDGGNDGFGVPAVVPVPLTVEGDNYYFSDADDGIQCIDGLRFVIHVAHGRGLPADLSQPPPPPYVDRSPPAPSTGSSVTGTSQGQTFYNGGAGKGVGGSGVGMCGLLMAGAFGAFLFV